MLNQFPQIPSTEIEIPGSVYGSIADLACQLQEHYAIESGVTYDVRDLQQAVLKWLSGSIESLVDDGMFHLIEGRREHSFNRSEFDRALAKLQPLEAQQSAPAVAA